jgi:hypothetical protein
MPYTLGYSIERFREDVVDLDPDQTKTARSSRDFLFAQLKSLDVHNEYIFPKLYKDPMPYGSFARKTKIRPLDDIDLLLLLEGYGTKAEPLDQFTYYLRQADKYSVLSPFCDPASNPSPGYYGWVNSTKVLNAVKSGITKVAYYRNSEIKRNRQAIVLNLTSHDWSFDVVPAVPIRDWEGLITYYLIPDGSGHWIRTDPRRDNKRLTAINQRHAISIQSLVRLLKKWNRRLNKPSLESYYFETLCLSVFEYARSMSSLSEAVKYFFLLAPDHLIKRCPDPKGLGKDLDAGVDLEVKGKIETAMRNAYLLASSANSLCEAGNDKDAINDYRTLFGQEFPVYG